MALVRTVRHTQSSGAGYGSGTFVTDQFTPSANSLLTVFVVALVDGGQVNPVADMTIASPGVTFAERGAAGRSEYWSQGVKVWTAQVTGGTPMALTLDVGSLNIYLYRIIVVEHTGHDTASPVGATVSDTDLGTSGQGSMQLSAAPAVSSDVLAVILNDSTSPGEFVTPGSGWVELVELTNPSGWTDVELQARTGSTSDIVTWDNVSSGGANKTMAVALEIRSAAAAPTTTQVSADLPAAYGINATVSADRAASYTISAPVNASLAASYGIAAPVNANLAAAYQVVTLVSADLAATYQVGNAVSADLTASYSVDSPLVPVSADLAASYAVRELVGGSLEAAYVLDATVRADLAAVYQLTAQALASVGADLSASYGIAALVHADLVAAYAVQSIHNYTRAPSGSGYSPARQNTTARPAGSNTTLRQVNGNQMRPAAIQRNTR